MVLRAQATLAAAEGRPVLALEHASRALTLAGQSKPPSAQELALAEQLRADILLRMRRIPDALARYEAALRHWTALSSNRPNQARSLLGRAEALLLLGRADEARQDIERTLKLPELQEDCRQRAAKLLVPLASK
jgi:tetratricopeptide (TPR) repeat protein